jgi:hypothetical protein
VCEKLFPGVRFLDDDMAVVPSADAHMISLDIADSTAAIADYWDILHFPHKRFIAYSATRNPIIISSSMRALLSRAQSIVRAMFEELVVVCAPAGKRLED